MTIQRNTFGYRDPQKAMSIKALQDRAAKTQAAMANVGGMEQIEGPWTGGATALQSLAANISNKRAMSDEADARQALAALMAKQKPGEYDPNLISQIGVYDSDLANALREENLKVLDREDTQDFTTQERLGTQGFQAGMQDDRQAADIAAANALYAQQSKENELTRAAEMARLKYTEAQAAGRQDDAQAAAQELAAINAKLETEKEAAKLRLGNENIAPANAAREAEADRLKLPPESEARKQYITTGDYTTHQAVKPSEMYTPAEKVREDKLAEAAVQWETEGGPAAIAQLKQVNKAIELLQTSPGITGFQAALTQGVADRVLPEGVARAFGAWYNPDGTIAKEAIQESVQSTMRQVMGAQFTEREGVGLMERAFNPGLPPEENVRRAKLLLERMGGVAQQKEALLEHRKKNRDFLTFQGGVDTSAVTSLLDDDFGSGAPGGDTATTPAPDTAPATPDTGAPVFDPAVDKEGDTGSDERGEWTVIGNKWVLTKPAGK